MSRCIKLILLVVFSTTGINVAKASTSTLDEIARLQQKAPQRSAGEMAPRATPAAPVRIMTLSNGTVIPVALAARELKKCIYEPDFRTIDGMSIDLTLVTGKVAAKSKSAQATPVIGQMIIGQGIFLGQYKPGDRAGNNLGKIFNVFAAPQDLPDTMRYVDAVKCIANLKGWNGFDGTNYATDKELYAAIKSGNYNGGWIIPTRELLSDMDVDGTATQPGNLYAHKNTGALKGTFTEAATSSSRYPDWYWSSMENRDDSSNVLVIRFSDGVEDWDVKDFYRFSCRPVRLAGTSAPAPV